MTSCDLGDVVVVTGTFGANPSAVGMEYRFEADALPNLLTPTALDPILDEDGVTVIGYPYQATFKPQAPGRYFIRVDGTGANEAAEEWQITVRPSGTRP